MFKLLTQNAKIAIAAAVAPTEYINPEYASARVKVYFLAYLVTVLPVEETVPLINVPIKGLPDSIRVIDPSDKVYSLRGTCLRIVT